MEKNISKSKQLKLAIVGMGRFGSLVHKLITQHFPNVIIFTMDKQVDRKHLTECDVVIIAVPISKFRKAVLNIKNEIADNTVVIEVCSVQTHPAKVLLELVPNANLISCHPMFGPDSISEGLEKLRIVVSNINSEKSLFLAFKKTCKELGLTVIEITPEEHDRQVAFSQTFTHLIGRLMETMEIKTTKINTPTFTKLLEIKRIITSDTPELFQDMNKFNPFAKDMRKKMITTLKEMEINL